LDFGYLKYRKFNRDYVKPRNKMFPYFLRPFKEPINIEGISNYITHLCFTNTSKRSIYFSDFKYNNKI